MKMSLKRAQEIKDTIERYDMLPKEWARGEGSFEELEAMSARLCKEEARKNAKISSSDSLSAAITVGINHNF